MHVSPVSLTSNDAASTARADQAAKRAATEFESLFLSKLATVSREQSDDEDGDMFRSDAMDQYQQMYGEQLGTTMAENGGIGLADVVLRQIRENRGEKADGSKNPLHALRQDDVARVAARGADAASATTAVPRRETIIPRAAAKASATSSDDLLQMPVRGRVRSESVSKGKSGVDITTRRGAEIGAAADGKVIFAGRQTGYGNTVVIQHDGGRMTRYANLARITVAEGASVEKGQTVALAGKTGRSGKSHVHFEVVESGRQVDPLAAVSRDRAAARAQKDVLSDATPTLARAAEAAESILAPTPALAVTATTATSPLRASVILPAGAVRAVSNEVVIPGALGRRPSFQSKEVSLSLPAHGRISSNFGVRRDPFTGRARVHEGVDIAVPTGTPIQAAAAGTVVFAGKQRGYGNTIIVEHADGRKTRYAHASKLNVTVGETVGKGETIGLVGSTGRSTGPHLHFEVIDEGRHVNPLAAVAYDSRLAGR